MSARLSEARFYENLRLKYLNDYDAETALNMVKCDIRKHLNMKDILDEMWNDRYGDQDKIYGKFFLTIRPKDELNIIPFLSFTRKLFTKKLWKDYHIVFEQKGETINELGKGKHFHAIIDLSCPTKGKSFHIREIFNLVKKMNLEDFIPNNAIDLRKISDKKNLEMTENYINTKEFLKGNNKKQTSWSFDNLWRNQNNIAEFYNKDIEISPILTSLSVKQAQDGQ